MNIFVLNSGSSSIKYQLFTMPSTQPVCTGLLERIGMENSIITHKTFLQGKEEVVKKTMELPDHTAGLQQVAHLLTDPQKGVIHDPSDIQVVGHRVVHGGETFAQHCCYRQPGKGRNKETFPVGATAQSGKLHRH